MPREKAESKEKTKSKSTSKSKTKSKTAVAKTKAHATTKAHAATKAHAKPKAHAKSKTSAKPKKRATPKVHVKHKAPVKSKAHAKPKSTPKKAKPTSKFEFDDTQSGTLLTLVEQIITLHKHKQGGLKSFYNIDRILDRYNQHYTNAVDKLDAIIKYGMEKDPAVVHEHFYVVVNGRNKDENDLYQLLSGIGHGKIKFEDAKNKMIDIYKGSSQEK